MSEKKKSGTVGDALRSLLGLQEVHKEIQNKTQPTTRELSIIPEHPSVAQKRRNLMHEKAFKIKRY